jgi:signal recognition particle receptor subunit beta
MLRAPIATDEQDRLADLRALRLLDTPREERFDRIVRLAAQVLDVPIAYIALVDSDRPITRDAISRSAATPFSRTSRSSCPTRGSIRGFTTTRW